MTDPVNKIWITWEKQRRSIVLAKELGCTFFMLEVEGLFRYPISIFKTIVVLARERPDYLFVQNPSMVLATLACLYGRVSKTIVVVDRHTTFRLNKPKDEQSLSIWIFMKLHYLTLRLADLTIVTNDFLASLVRNAGGTPFVLPDMLPSLKKENTRVLKGHHNILLISSFGADEPIAEALDAMKVFGDDDVFLYITGNCNRLDSDLLDSAPQNVVFTGFVSDQEFVDLLFSVDAVMVLTTSDACMLCGCYEAVSAEKPLITSDKEVLVEYFKEATFVNNTASGISDGIKNILKNIPDHAMRSTRMKSNIGKLWEVYFANLLKFLEQAGKEQR